MSARDRRFFTVDGSDKVPRENYTRVGRDCSTFSSSPTDFNKTANEPITATEWAF
jgi:hypothetical protein